MTKQQARLRVRLYARLSKDDGDADKESNSITNQLQMLRYYSKEKGFEIKYIGSYEGIEKEISENAIFKRICDKEEKVGKAQCGVLQLAIAFAYYKKWKKEYK